MESGRETVGQQDCACDRDHRDGGRDHTQAHAADYDGRGAGLRAFSQLLGGLIRVRGVVFGDLADDHAGSQAADHGKRQPPPFGQPVLGLETEEVEDSEGESADEDGCQVRAHAERAEQVLERCTLFRADRKNADYRQRYADGGDQHRGHDRAQLHGGAGREERGSAKSHGCEDRAAVRLVQIRAHSGDIAHIVSDVVRDGRGVARIVLGDVLLHLSDYVGAHVGGLCVDSAAHACKQRLRACAHAEGQHGGGNHDQRLSFARLMHERIEHDPPDADVQQAEAHDGQAHDGAGAERELEAAVQRALGGIGRPCRGVCCRAHAHVSCQTGEETAGEECERHPGVLDVQSVGEEREQKRQDNEYDDNDFVLLLEIGHCPFAHILCDLFHGRGAFVFLLHLLEEDIREH